MDFGDTHRRSIANALRYTEERLGQVEAALTDQGNLNILRRIEDDLTPLQKEKISGCIRAIRSLIASLKETLSLEAHAIPLSQVIGGTTSSLWVTLIDTEPKRLTRYGPVPEEISTALGPALEELIAQIHEMQAIIAHR
ncbi:MAG: hypothetical protein HYZ72_04290 [Deltaproteobacteria bacterium]|nr:hypothetical protein [Deltaproteobacteria bacterium]